MGGVAFTKTFVQLNENEKPEPIKKDRSLTVLKKNII